MFFFNFNCQKIKYQCYEKLSYVNNHEQKNEEKIELMK